MAPRPGALDWSLVQAFLAVAEHGSLSAAARVLRVSQPTLGRQVHAMEEQLGAELFQRHDKGLSLTETGRALLAPARAMRDAAHGIELRAAGQSEAIEGSVRITASVIVSLFHLPEMIAQMRSELPQVAIDLVPSDETSNLHHRAADIAVRMYRPSQLDLVTLHVGDLAIGGFASRSYIARRGLPERPDDLLAHDLVGADQDTIILDGFRQAGVPITRDAFQTRTDDPAVYWALVRAGCGIGFTQRAVGLKDPSLVEVPLPPGMPTLPVWLTAHESVRRMPRVDRVWSLLEAGLRKVIADAGAASA